VPELKLTPGRSKSICKAVANGMSYAMSAKLCGISEATLYGWLRRGKAEPSGPYFRFLQAIKKAEAELAEKLLERIDAAGRGGAETRETKIVVKTNPDGSSSTEKTVVTKYAPPCWQADAWKLERRYPTEYGKLIRTESDDEGSSMDDIVEKLDEARSSAGLEDHPVGE